jgi:sortase A
MKRILWIAPAILVIAGSGLEGRAVYLRAKGALAGVLIRRAWSETLRTGADTRPWPHADTHPIARLRIPALRYDEIVLEGASPRTLAFGPARMMCGATSGEPGNLLIAGHRTSWFLPLRYLRCGDTLVLETLDERAAGPRRRTYRVETIRVVSPQDVSFLRPTPGDCLTLVTCWPFGAAPKSSHRFVVRASCLPPRLWEPVPAEKRQTCKGQAVWYSRIPHPGVSAGGWISRLCKDMKSCSRKCSRTQ